MTFHDQPPRRQFRLYALSALFFGLLFGVLLVGAELFVRNLHTRGSTETRDHLTAVDYMPSQMKPHYQGEIWGVPFRTNQFGLRDEEDFPEEPPANEYRILSLGDSIAFGLGIPSSDHYTKILERDLNNSGRGQTRYRVINASGPGYSPSCYYVYLLHDGLRLKPRLVVLEIELCNDVTDEALLRWEGTSEDPRGLERVRGGRYVVGWDGALLATVSVGPYFFERTYVYTDLLRRTLNLLYTLNPTQPFAGNRGVTYYSLGFDRYLLDNERIESGWKRIFGALERTHELLRSEGIEFLLVIMPTQYMFDPATGDYGKFARELVERAVREAERRNLPFVDFTEVMERGGGKELYFDFAHPTGQGNKVIAAELRRYVTPNGLRRPSRD